MRSRSRCVSLLAFTLLGIGMAPPTMRAATPAPPPAKPSPASLIGITAEGSKMLLPFSRFYHPGPRALEFTPELKALDGKRVQAVGFMAEMEEPSPGCFYLVSEPVMTAEGGGGDGDLPPTAIRVLVRSARGKLIGLMRGLVSVTGKLQVGSFPDDLGRYAFLQLTLDRPQDLRKGASPDALARPTGTQNAPPNTASPRIPHSAEKRPDKSSSKVATVVKTSRAKPQ